ncbi:MAG: hypothetical protein JWO56_1342 [Acidobacteria bacterium]|nr:hypothetical protein [Acidobacteriota bacterium]
MKYGNEWIGIRRTCSSSTPGTRAPICGNVSMRRRALRASCANRSATRMSRSRYQAAALSSSTSAGLVMFSGFNDAARLFRFDPAPFASSCSRGHRRVRRRRAAESRLPTPLRRPLPRPAGYRAIRQRFWLARREEVPELRSADPGQHVSSMRNRSMRTSRPPPLTPPREWFGSGLCPRAHVPAHSRFRTSAEFFEPKAIVLQMAASMWARRAVFGM